MNAPAYKTRFAPSPTGLLHLGNVRTALFNALLARHERGVFLLRLEDTDAVRGHDKYAQALQEDLHWLGLDWQEGPGADGAHGPYWQSQRGDIYARYFDELQVKGHAYRCFCTEHELEISRKTQLAAGRPPRYSGRCHRLSPAEVERRLVAGTPATVRFHVPDDETVVFEDAVRGTQSFATTDIGDFVIRRSDGTPAFFFSNAIDDALMGVTLVLRGEDHLTNTPRQILMLRALDLAVPAYAHMALVVGGDGAPLSKRTGSLSVQELRAAGYMPIAINNYLARLGHTYEDNALLSLDELGARFSLARLHRAPARYDATQLLHWQKEAIASASDQELWTWLSSQTYIGGARIQAYIPDGTALPFVRTVRDNITLPIEAYAWAAHWFARDGRYDKEAQAAIAEAGRDFFTAALRVLDADEYKAYTQALVAATGRKGKALFLPLRAAWTGMIDAEVQRLLPDGPHWHSGPELARVWTLLGRDRLRARLEAALALFETGRT